MRQIQHECEWLFQTEAYLRKFQATVTALEDNQVAQVVPVVLDRTAFYPGGGGQPSDRGVLEASDEIWHEVEGEPPAAGTTL